MSKSANSNIIIPALGGVALICGIGYGVAMKGYGDSRISSLEERFERSQEQIAAAQDEAAAQAARVTELQASLEEARANAESEIAEVRSAAEADMRKAENELRVLRQQVQTASSQPMDGQNPDKLDGAGDIVLAAASEPAPENSGGYGIGREALPEEIAAWNVDVLPDGRGLPEGSGDVWTGEEVFGEYCASCHGDFAEGRGNWPVLAGGFGTLDDRDPVKTVGSYWPYLSTVWDYVHRSMPFGQAGTLTNDEVYAIVAYILYSNSIVEDDFTLSKETFAEVEMPNADGFIVDDRPEEEYAMWRGEPCMENCKDGPVEITRRASDVNVTPEGKGSMAESPMEVALAKFGGEAWGMEEMAGTQELDESEAEVEGSATDEAAAESASPQMMTQENAESEGEGEQMAAAETETQETSEPEAAEVETVSVEADPELVAAGEKVFRKCQSCHQVGDGAKNRTGPVLNGVVGAPFAHVDDFKYSNVFQQAHDEGRVWDQESLTGFLENPRGYLKGTKMSFAGLKSQDDIDAVIAYLSTFEMQ